MSKTHLQDIREGMEVLYQTDIGYFRERQDETRSNEGLADSEDHGAAEQVLILLAE